MSGFAFELVSPEKLVFSGEVQQVVVPGTEGDFAVLSDHAPIISSLRPGFLTITTGKGESQTLFVRGGFADVSAKGLTILAEIAVPTSDLTDAIFDQEIALATADVSAAKSDETRQIADERLAQIEALRTDLRH